MTAVLLLLVLALLAVGCVVLLPLSLRPDLVTGPPWLGGVVVGGLTTPLVLAGLLGLGTGPVQGVPLVVAMAALVVVAAAGGSPMATGVLRLADPAAARAAEGIGAGIGADTGASGVTGAATAPATMSTPGLLRGGSMLGLLERLAVFGTLAAGFPEGIAAVVAIKGLGRFGEALKTPAAPERFMVGTLASLLWGCACWAVAVAVLR